MIDRTERRDGRRKKRAFHREVSFQKIESSHFFSSIRISVMIAVGAGFLSFYSSINLS